jgi:hypothetical protein
MRIECPSPEAVMCLEGYAEMCVHINDFGDKEYSERAAAVRLMDRCAKALEDAGYKRDFIGYGNYVWVKKSA